MAMKIYIRSSWAKLFWNTCGQGRISEIIMSVCIGIMLIEIGYGVMVHLMK
jgi:hypothetical protein